MDKLVLKTALLSLVAVIVAALLVFSLWMLSSPQTMASACEKTGNYRLAVTCADLRYKYTKNAADLARCAEDGILAGDDGYIVKYGEKLVAHSGYEELCAQKDKQLADSPYAEYTRGYNTYICGWLASAQYRSGAIEKAVQTAESGGVHSFNKLVIEIAQRRDAPAAESVLDALGKYQNEEAESLMNILRKFKA